MIKSEILKKGYYFLATPLYSFHGNRLVWDPKLHKHWKKIVKILEKNGVKVIVALRDLNQNKSGSWLRETEFRLIRHSLGIIVILGNTPGIYFESGFAKGIKKKLYGLRTENLLKMGLKVQQWIESAFDAVFDSPEDLAKHLVSKSP